MRFKKYVKNRCLGIIYNVCIYVCKYTYSISIFPLSSFIMSYAKLSISKILRLILTNEGASGVQAPRFSALSPKGTLQQRHQHCYCHQSPSDNLGHLQTTNHKRHRHHHHHDHHHHHHHHHQWLTSIHACFLISVQLKARHTHCAKHCNTRETCPASTASEIS